MKAKNIYTYPYVIWSAIFIVIPLLLVIYYSFRLETDHGSIFSLLNYKEIADKIYLMVFLRSFILAGIATVLCILIGYPVAYFISQIKGPLAGKLILLFILPMWMNFLLRTYAWIAILGKNGILNTLLGYVGIQNPPSILYTYGAVLLGMVYNFLPFMVLPIYTSLTKIDMDLVNAARDLGADTKTVFTKIIFPLTLPGVLSGITMVFMPAVTTFAISRLLGGGKTMLVGDLIEQQFTVVGDWGFGSSLSIVMMVIILISMSIMNKVDKGSTEGGGL